MSPATAGDEYHTLKSFAWWSGWRFFGYVVIPVVAILLMPGERLRDYYIQFTGFIKHLWIYVTLFGLILNRFNVSWFAVKHPDPLFYMPTFMSNVKYFPTLPEVAVSIGIFSAGILAFGLAAKYLPVFEAERETEETHPSVRGLKPVPTSADD